MFVLRKLQNSLNTFTKLSTNQLESRSAVLTHNIHSHTVLKNIVGNEETVNVNIKGKNFKFPFVWLRENCQCAECFHTTAKSRIIEWNKFNIDVQPKAIKETGDSIQVAWDDGHSSEYSFDWLKFRSFTNTDKKTYKDKYFKPPKKTWNGDNFRDIFTKHDYNEIINTDKGLHDWLLNLSIYGVALIENTPDRENAVDNIVAKVGFTRRTHYGVKFIVQHVPNTSNVAYLSSNLQMHTDLPYYDYCPGVNILHCLVQTTSQGGQNLLTDCHFVANYMKEHHPEEYRLLTELEVEWHDVGVEDGNEFYKLHRSPVICLNRHNEIYRVNFSIPQRGSHFLGEIEEVRPWYKAHSLFFELSQKFAARFKTKAGQMLVFDNIRLLHGRTAYDDVENNVRKIIGAYVDWDEISSRLRCVKVKLEGTKL